MPLLINTAVFLAQLQQGERQSDLVKTLVGLPIAGVQVRGEFFTAETREQELQTLMTFCDEQGWECHYSVPEMLFQAGKVNPALEMYLTLAERYHLASLKFSLGEADVAAIAEAKAMIANHGVVVTIENEGNANGTVANLEGLLPTLATEPAIGFTFDAGNWYWVSKNYNVVALFKQLKPYVTVLHLKNIALASLETALIQAGDTDWQALVAQNAPEVPIFLEYAIPTAQLHAEIETVLAAMKPS